MLAHSVKEACWASPLSSREYISWLLSVCQPDMPLWLSFGQIMLTWENSSIRLQLLFWDYCTISKQRPPDAPLVSLYFLNFKAAHGGNYALGYVLSIFVSTQHFLVHTSFTSMPSESKLNSFVLDLSFIFAAQSVNHRCNSMRIRFFLSSSFCFLEVLFYSGYVFLLRSINTTLFASLEKSSFFFLVRGKHTHQHRSLSRTVFPN